MIGDYMNTLVTYLLLLVSSLSPLPQNHSVSSSRQWCITVPSRDQSYEYWWFNFSSASLMLLSFSKSFNISIITSIRFAPCSCFLLIYLVHLLTFFYWVWLKVFTFIFCLKVFIMVKPALITSRASFSKGVL